MPPHINSLHVWDACPDKLSYFYTDRDRFKSIATGKKTPGVQNKWSGFMFLVSWLSLSKKKSQCKSGPTSAEETHQISLGLDDLCWIRQLRILNYAHPFKSNSTTTALASSLRQGKHKSTMEAQNQLQECPQDHQNVTHHTHTDTQSCSPAHTHNHTCVHTHTVTHTPHARVGFVWNFKLSQTGAPVAPEPPSGTPTPATSYDPIWGHKGNCINVV